jgi:hypothetical protein
MRVMAIFHQLGRFGVHSVSPSTIFGQFYSANAHWR